MGKHGEHNSYDLRLERAAFWQLRSVMEVSPGRDIELAHISDDLLALDEAKNGPNHAAIITASPHRYTGLAWECLARHWRNDPGSPSRRHALALASAQILDACLDLPQVTVDRLRKEAREEITDVLARFDIEAGRSGAHLDVFANEGRRAS
ncbi:MAG: hypothetical protein WA989_05265 [Henriciella sp.]|uniref:hypothetical protein n=1 Tax=Henriciella sp. TaxID=1968823 RepID=UPI003C76D25A